MDMVTYKGCMMGIVITIILIAAVTLGIHALIIVKLIKRSRNERLTSGKNKQS